MEDAIVVVIPHSICNVCNVFSVIYYHVLYCRDPQFDGFT